MRLVILVLLLSCLPVLAQPARPRGGDPGGQVMQLTTEQTASLKSIRDRYEDLRQDVLVRLKAKRLELVNLLRQDDVDKATVKAKLDEILALEAERQTLFLNEMFEAKAQLKPGQWKAYRRQIFKSLMDGGGGRKGRGQ
jgi:Spy/CpxP family protein refolding chaperone